MSLRDPEVVRAEYATETGLAGRKAAYRFAEGPNPYDVALQAVAETRPRRIVEVGCGKGELAERMQADLGAEVIALDQSERMVELTRARGVAAVVGDVQALPFADGEFDSAVAAWMLFHVPDLDRALSELARVLRPGGRLVAVTNGSGHLQELRDLLGVEPFDFNFHGDNGIEVLSRHFGRVTRRDATGWIAFPDRDSAQGYVDSSITWRGRELPRFEGALRVRRSPYVFVADK